MTVVPKVLEEALKVRSEQRVIFRAKPAGEDAPQVPVPPAAAEEAPTEAPAEAPETPVQEAPPQEDSTPEAPQEKGGFFSRFFGRKDS